MLMCLQTSLSWLASPRVQASLEAPTLSLDHIRDGAVDGRPLSAFFVMPLERQEAYRPLVRLWATMILQAAFRRKTQPERPTLAIFDEAAALGGMDGLKTVATQVRSFGLVPHLLYQCISQLKAAFPHDWQLFLGNAEAITAFGQRHGISCRELEEALGYAGDLRSLAPDEQVVSQPFHDPRRMRRLSVVTDAWLAKRAAPNPFHVDANSKELN
jgi:type IV secretory pathway TraG/TraD family ATPase VirD4